MIAFDTNILIYAEDPNDSRGRHARAVSILSLLAFGQAIVPVQVLGEFVNVCRKKALVTPDVAIEKIENYSILFETPQTEVSDVQMAALLARQYNLQYFDALIVTVSARAGATALLSEDMQDGLEVEGLRVVNPFSPANEALLAGFLGSAI